MTQRKKVVVTGASGLIAGLMSPALHERIEIWLSRVF